MDQETKFPRVLDNTMYSDWKACHHRFFRRHCQGLTRARTNVHLHFGACFAAAQETVRMEWLGWSRIHAQVGPDRWVKTDDMTGDLKECVKAGAERFLSEWGAFSIPDGASQTERNKNVGAGLIALEDYYRQWPLGDDPYEVYVHDGKPTVEFSFALPIPSSHHPETGEPILYCGRFDAIMRRSKVLYGLDDKTTSSLGDHWRNQWRLRSQFTGYVWGAESYGIPLDGFVVRGTCILKTDIKFEEVVTARPPFAVSRWLEQLKYDVTEMCEEYDQIVVRQLAKVEAEDDGRHPFGRNLDHACSDFNGCEYLDLCASQTPDAWLSDYRVERWDPLLRTTA